MRLFVALALPDDVRAGLAERVRALEPASPPGLRWAAPERWHLTLCFLGEVEDERVPAVAASLGRKVDRHRTVDLRLGGAGRFGRRVLWVGIGGDLDRLARLAAAVAAGARRARVDVEDRPYRPHLTVARNAGQGDLATYVAALDDYVGPTWTADSVALVRSRLGQRPTYETVEAWPLSPAQLA